MSKNAIDRRVPRTRAMLQQALLALIRSKRYEAITVNDICQAANVGRSTFYAHYTSKDDLKRSGLESMRRSLIDRQRAILATSEGRRDQSLSFSLSILEHARDRLDHYRALISGRGGSIALTKIRQMVSELVRNELAATANKSSADAIPHDVVVQHVVGAYMAVLIWWLDGGAKLPPERIDAMFRRLAIEGIQSLGH